MKPVIAISKSELEKYAGAERMFTEHSESVIEEEATNIYIIKDSAAFVDLFCFLRDHEAHFIYGHDEELNEILSKTAEVK